ncbi:MAG: GNAT family N-acetyltransferase [Verrucomicrobia bacterium]|nr:GNAT family N-acetyltransferase [Verrucomicrobiota bacterium]
MKIRFASTKAAHKIRLAKFSDFDRLLRLVAAYYKFDSIAFDERVTGRALRRLLSNKSFGRIWVIEWEGTLVGYMVLTFNYDLEYGGLEGLVTDLFVARRFRRKGLGALMMATARNFCRRRGISAIELQVTRHNRAAQVFYRALGFKALDRIVMSLDIRPDFFALNAK